MAKRTNTTIDSALIHRIIDAGGHLHREGAANEAFQQEEAIVSATIEMLESERFVRWYEDKFVPNYIEDRVVSRDEIINDLKGLLKRGSNPSAPAKNQPEVRILSGVLAIGECVHGDIELRTKT